MTGVHVDQNPHLETNNTRESKLEIDQEESICAKKRVLHKMEEDRNMGRILKEQLKFLEEQYCW